MVSCFWISLFGRSPFDTDTLIPTFQFEHTACFLDKTCPWIRFALCLNVDLPSRSSNLRGRVVNLRGRYFFGMVLWCGLGYVLSREVCREKEARSHDLTLRP